jgi:hypothetical protein
MARTPWLAMRAAVVMGLALMVGSTGTQAELERSGCTACITPGIIWCGDWDAADIACEQACPGTKAQVTSCAPGGCMPNEQEYLCW